MLALRQAGLLGAAVSVGVLVLTLGCRAGNDATATAAPVERLNVVVLLLDTLRPDHLGLYGYARPTSPFLDDLATRSVVFDNALSAAAATFPSVNTLFTSRPPLEFYATSSDDLGIPEHLETLAEQLTRAGWTTHAISSSPVVRAAPSFFNPGGGFGQGFSGFDEDCGKARRHVQAFSTDCVLGHAAKWLEQRDEEPFFLYLHNLDPHDPYQPPVSESLFADPDYQAEIHVLQGRTHPILQAIERGDPQPISEADRRHYVDLYDGEVRAVDRRIGLLFDRFREAPWFDRTLFVILSDHGESFLEHDGAWHHGGTVYQTETRMLLLLHGAGTGAAMRRQDLACTADVAPTILERAGVARPATWVGRDLFAEGAESEDRPCSTVARSDWDGRRATRWAVRSGPWKMMAARGTAPSLVDLRRDPNERHDLLVGAQRPEIEPGRLRELRRRMSAMQRWTGRQGVDPVALDPRALEALRALGYVE